MNHKSVPNTDSASPQLPRIRRLATSLLFPFPFYLPRCWTERPKSTASADSTRPSFSLFEIPVIATTMGAVATKSLGFTFSLGLLILISCFLVLFRSSLPGTPSYRSWISPSTCSCEASGRGAYSPAGIEDPQRRPGNMPASAYLEEFRTIPEFEDMTTTGDALWSQMTSTRSGGFLWVRHNETYRTGYGVSMFHALHCLSMIRDTVRGNSMDMKRKRGLEARATEAEMHTAHCFSYVAQSLLCSADGTLERPKTLYDEAGNVLRDDVNGDFVAHQCKGAGFLRDMIEGSEERSLSEMPEMLPGATMWDLYDRIA